MTRLWEMLSQYPFACFILPVSMFVLPAMILIAGVRRKSRWRIWVGAVWLVLSAFALVRCIDGFSARHEGILERGTTPAGREYVLFQTCKGEPCQVMLYARDESGQWRAYFEEDNVWPWRDGGRVESTYGFGITRIVNDGKTVSLIDFKYPLKYEKVYPSSMTAEDVFGQSRQN